MSDQYKTPICPGSRRRRSPAFGRLFKARRRQSELGVTLLEVLVVLGIIVLLATVVGPRVVGYFSKAKTDTAQLQLNALVSAVELYALDMGSYPPQEPGLQALVTPPVERGSWNGPYLAKSDGLKDPWGRDYRYRIPGDHGPFDIYSLGRDDTDGGEGEDRDVVSW